jgi:hypothetical protein
MSRSRCLYVAGIALGLLAVVPLHGPTASERVVLASLPAEDLTILSWGPHDEGEIAAMVRAGSRPRPGTHPAVARLLRDGEDVRGVATIVRVRYRCDAEKAERDELYLVAGGRVRIWAAQPWGDEWRERVKQTLIR